MSSSLTDINKVLSLYTKNVNTTMQSVFEITARDAANKLKQSSPKDKGEYARNWAVKKEAGKATVYNKKTYRLTHLLENGHDVVVNGVKVGHANPQVHIKTVDEWVQNEVMQRLQEALGNVN